jgi:hypothetical protein
MEVNMTAKLLSRDAVLAADDRASEVVEVPEWGGSVQVRALSGTERDQYESAGVTWGRDAKGAPIVAALNTDNLRARLVALAVVDEEGNRLFSDKDVAALGAKNAQVLNRLFEVARRLSGLSAADVEALTQGLKGDQNGRSGSA